MLLYSVTILCIHVVFYFAIGLVALKIVHNNFRGLSTSHKIAQGLSRCRRGIVFNQKLPRSEDLGRTGIVVEVVGELGALSIAPTAKFELGTWLHHHCHLRISTHCQSAISNT